MRVCLWKKDDFSKYIFMFNITINPYEFQAYKSSLLRQENVKCAYAKIQLSSTVSIFEYFVMF